MRKGTEEDVVMTHNYEIEAGNFTKAGEASSSIKGLLRQLGIDAKVVRRISIATYETEMNMVIHSLGGKLKIEITPKSVILRAQDLGPGIEDVDKAMEEGFSTATEHARELGFGAGMGLPNIKRCSDKFSIESQIGKGTNLKAEFII